MPEKENLTRETYVLANKKTLIQHDLTLEKIINSYDDLVLSKIFRNGRLWKVIVEHLNTSGVREILVFTQIGRE